MDTQPNENQPHDGQIEYAKTQNKTVRLHDETEAGAILQSTASVHGSAEETTDRDKEPRPVLLVTPTTPPQPDVKPTPMTDAQEFEISKNAKGDPDENQSVVPSALARALERQLSDHTQLLAIQTLKSREAHAAYVNELRSILKLPEGTGLCDALREMVKTSSEKDAETAEDKTAAARYRWLRSAGLQFINWDGLTCDACDIGLDHAIDSRAGTEQA